MSARNVLNVTTYEHEAPLRLLQDNPKLAEELYCGLLGRSLPDHTGVRSGSEAMTRGDDAVIRHCDNIAIYYRDDRPVFAVLFEVQLGIDKDKHYSWLDYLASARTKLRCPVALVVIAFDEATAAWARGPIDTGHPSLILYPLVIGPDLIPLITDPEQGRENLPLALLSLIAHARGERGVEVMRTYQETIRPLDQETWSRYAEYALNALRENLSMQLQEMIMSDKTLPNSYRYGILGEKYREGHAGGRAEGLAEGLAEGERNMLYLIIDRLDIPLSDTARERIDACDDPEVLQQWADGLLRTNSADHIGV